MAYTLRNVSREAHIPQENKLLTGELGKGIGSVKKIVKAAQTGKEKAEKLIADLKASEEAAA